VGDELALAYAPDDLRRLGEIVPTGFRDPLDLRKVLDWYGYLAEWKQHYAIQSVQSSLRSTRITCIDAAILSYGLLEVLFPPVKRRLLAIHRRARKDGEECGHCVTLFWNDHGKVGAFSKSSFPGLGHRDPIYEDEFAVAASYAKAYMKMGIDPLYFGVTTLEDAAREVDWRYSPGELNVLSERIQACYAYGFMTSSP
jgi:hypothetical protein